MCNFPPDKDKHTSYQSIIRLHILRNQINDRKNPNRQPTSPSIPTTPLTLALFCCKQVTSLEPSELSSQS